MSNKTLAYLLVIIVLLAAGFFVIWRMNLNKQNKSLGEETEKQQQQTQQITGDQANTIQQEQEQNAAVDCERNFSQATLDSAQVEIKGRTVELAVKDFGKIEIELYDGDAPKTVENFLRLINAGYYDCLTIHRVAKGFVIQGGDPTGTGAGGDSAFGGEFEDELNQETKSFQDGYKKGVLAMANRGAHTNTSQFFIMLEDVSLPSNYTIFGKVAAGQEVVDKIGQVDITPQLGPTDGKPVFPVVIEKATIIK